MIKKVMDNDDDIIAEKPPISVFSIVQKGISDEEYARTAYRFARQCGVKLSVKEAADSYSYYFYLRETIALGEYALDWVQLIQESDLHSLSVYSGLPQIIKASFYRIKHEKSDS